MEKQRCYKSRYVNQPNWILVLIRPGVNFINILRARFLYESAFL